MLFSLINLGEISDVGNSISATTMAIRAAIFLILLIFGGYLFVKFHRRGGFFSASMVPGNDGIKIISVKILGYKRSIMVVEHAGRRFLLGLSADKLEKLSEWNQNDGNSDNK